MTGHHKRWRIALAFSLVVVGAVAASALPLRAQETDIGSSPVPSPSVGVSLGFGSVLGWLGGSVEKYFSGGRVSAAVGAGYVPETDEGNPAFAAFGAGVRRYFGAGKHRVALEASVSLISFQWVRQGPLLLESNKYYGPGLAVGYRYTADSGLHFDASLGAGWAVGDDSIGSVGSLAVGYTWRR